MAESTETILLDVQLDASKVRLELDALLKNLGELRAQQEANNEKFKDGKISFEQYEAESKRLREEISILTKEEKGLLAQIKILEKGTEAYSNTLNGQRALLNDMLKSFDSLTESERQNEKVGGALQKAIEQQTEKVSELEEATGRHQRNVGNYPSALKPAIGVLEKFGISIEDLQNKGVKSFANIGKSVKALGKAFLTPPVAVIVVAVAAIMKVFELLSDAFRRNDEASTRMQRALAALEPIGTLIAKVFDKVAEGIVNVVEKLSKGAEKIISFVARLFKMDDAYKAASKSAKELVTAQDDLEEAERKFTINQAKRQRDIAKLNAEVKKTNDPAERKNLLDKIQTLEKQSLQAEVNIAAERLRILKADAKKRRDTSDETANAIADAEARLYDAQTRYYDGIAALNRQYNKAEKQQAADSKKTSDERIELTKEEIEIRKQLNEAIILAYKDENEKKIALARLEGQEEIEVLKRKLASEKNLTEQAKNDLAELIRLKQAKLDEDIDKMIDDAARERASKRAQLDEREIDANIESLKTRIKSIEDAQTEAEEDAKNRGFERVRESSDELVQLRIELLQAESQLIIDELVQRMDAELAQLVEGSEQYNEVSAYYKGLIYEQEQKLQTGITELYAEENNARLKDVEKWKKKYKDNLYEAADQASNAFGAMSDLLSNFSDENEKAGAAAKAFALIQIITDEAKSIAHTAEAIAAAVAGASEAAAATGPAAPIALAAYIAEMVGLVVGAVAGVAATIASAKQILSEANDAGKFASGGIVGGTSYTGDKLIAHVNSGEGIFTTKQQQRLFDIANGESLGGFNYETFAESVAAAVSAQPAPVVVLKELRDAQDRVSTINEIAKI